MDWIKDYSLFLFDFDGLLVDTESVHFQAYIDCFRKRGIDLDWTFPIFIGYAHTSSEALQEAFFQLDPHLRQDWPIFYAEKKKMYVELIHNCKILLMPGVYELLETLEKENKKRCVVTNSPLEHIVHIRNSHPILQTIPHWITREQYEKSKPHPECYEKAITLFSEKGDRMVGFEDSLRGINALLQTTALPVLINPLQHPHLQALIGGKVVHFESFDMIPKKGPLLGI